MTKPSRSPFWSASRRTTWRWASALLTDPLAYIFLGIATTILWFFLPPHADKVALVLTLLLSVKAYFAFKASKEKWTNWHERIVENYLPFTLLVFVAVAIGGSVQIIPSLIVNREKNIEGRLQELYTPLELVGRDLYVSEGCYNCHSQMIRTLVPDVMRYGRSGVKDDFSHLGESLFDHPYQWGSKRTGPDLAREGGALAVGSKYMRVGKRGNDWHFNHFLNPRQTSPGSNMPAYPWLFEKPADVKALPAKIAVQIPDRRAMASHVPARDPRPRRKPVAGNRRLTRRRQGLSAGQAGPPGRRAPQLPRQDRRPSRSSPTSRNSAPTVMS